jgi:hypothetical protein
VTSTDTEVRAADRWLIMWWIVLVALIFGSVEVATAALTGVSGQTTRAVVVVVLAFIKITIVAWKFMEVGHSARWLRGAMGCWIAVVCAVIVAMCVSSGGA